MDEWTARKTDITASRESISRHQLEKVQKSVARARRESPFYRKRLASYSEGFPESLAAYETLPFTFPGDLAAEPLNFLAASQDRVARIVTARTSGSAGVPKRVFFTERDLRETLEIFATGMTSLVRPGGRVLILLPGDRPGSVGRLLVQAIAPYAEGITHSFTDEKAVLKTIACVKADSLVGPPAPVLSLARHPQAHLARSLSSVLLCSDFASKSLEAGVREAWNCAVFRHYGLTETGYGGALSCVSGDGMHVMEANSFFEIVCLVTGKPLPEGEEGEIVFTSLAAEGTPLLRYRTGDRGRFLTGECPCGSPLRRMDIRGRLGNGLNLPEGFLPLADLDEALFSLSWLGNYAVRQEGNSIFFSLYSPDRRESAPELLIVERDEVEKVLKTVPLMKFHLERNEGATVFHFVSRKEVISVSGKRMVKRM